MKAPTVSIPKGKATCSVAIVDTQTKLTAPTHYLVEPKIAGHDWINLPTYAFYIRHEDTGAQLVFDLGARKDWHNSVPAIAGLIENHVPGLSVGKSMHEILTEGGVDLDDISAVILSHWHFGKCCGEPAQWRKPVTDCTFFHPQIIQGIPAPCQSTSNSWLVQDSETLSCLDSQRNRTLHFRNPLSRVEMFSRCRSRKVSRWDSTRPTTISGTQVFIS